MKIHHGWPRLGGPGSVITLGVFDGGHVGHRKILRRTVYEARRRKLRSVVLTFANHPASVLDPERAPRLLCTLAERLQRIAACGVDDAVVVRFTRTFSRIEAETFVSRWLVEACRARVVVVGPDTRFGHGRSGDVAMLDRMGKGLGFFVARVTPAQVGGAPVSSTRIRALLREGNVREAGRCLGRPYSLEGFVVSGRGRGRKLGAPTLNLRPGPVLLPATGVYAIRVEIGGRLYPAVANVGFRPTFERTRPVHPVIEAHLLSGPPLARPVGRPARFEFHARLRDEQKFPSGAALADQIQKDIVVARRLLGRIRS